MKGLEEHFVDLTSNFPEDYVKSYNAVLNAVKALEIIKDNLDSGTLGFDFKVDDKKNYKLEIYGLTQKEYDLLKEVLL